MNPKFLQLKAVLWIPDSYWHLHLDLYLASPVHMFKTHAPDILPSPASV